MNNFGKKKGMRPSPRPWRRNLNNGGESEGLAKANFIKPGFTKPFYSKSTTIPGVASGLKPNESTSWGTVATWYDSLLEGQDKDNTYQTTLILPNLRRLVDPKPGFKVLDLACGQGFFSRAWAVNGASVIASDVAPELIKIAKAIGYGDKDGNKNEIAKQAGEIEYFIKPSTDISFAEDNSMDVITCVLAMQNIELLAETFKECSRVLKSRTGRMYIVLNHPAFRIPKRSGWAYDEKTDSQFRRIDSYMSDIRSSIDMTPGIMDKGAKQYTVSFHHPLQTYFKALSKSGLAVTRLEEWISDKESLPGKRARAENAARKEIPLFMCLEIIKI